MQISCSSDESKKHEVNGFIEMHSITDEPSANNAVKSSAHRMIEVENWVNSFVNNSFSFFFIEKSTVYG